MKTILFTTDFTQSGSSALDWAKLIARQYNATLTLVHVYSPAIPAAPFGGMGEGMAITAPITEDLSRGHLAELAARLESEGIRVQSDWRVGGVDDEIQRAAQETQADLIVTGRRDLSSFFDRLVGTTATDVAKGASCPVLVVPSGSVAHSAQLQTIAFATQLEGNDSHAVGAALELARQFGAALELVHVRAENQPDLYDDNESLTELQAEFGEDSFVFHKTSARTVSGGLSDYLDKHPADLLIMTTRERGFLDGLLSPSLTGRMLTQSTTPILVYHT